MHFVPVLSWFESSRSAVQAVWFSCVVIALWATLAALRWPRQQPLKLVARGLWKTAMALLVMMWLSGATLEMMRRAAPLSGLQLVLALGAFSGLMAGVLSLAREWFGEGPNTPLSAAKIALSLLILTCAGWWLGGLALVQNPCWNLAAAAPRTWMPAGWALLVGGATLLGASRSVYSSDESVRRVRNPRLATWWIAATLLILGWPFGAIAEDINPGVASVFGAAGAVFGLKVWRVRADCPRFCRAPSAVRWMMVFFVALLPWMRSGPSPLKWVQVKWVQAGALAWHDPSLVVAWFLMALALFFLLTTLRQTLRLAIFERFCDRALLQGTLAGWILASLILGPGGAIFWAFWPLCGVFCDLLAPREFLRNASITPGSATSSPVATELPARELAHFEAAP